MARQVNVTSIEVLRRFQAALRVYAEAVQEVQETLLLETLHAVDWVEVDRATHWPAVARRASDELIEALNALERKQLTVDRSDPPACTEEKDAVQFSRRRLQHAEGKIAATRRWSHVVRHEADEYRGVLAKLSQLVETQLPQAHASLERMATALEKYAAQSEPGPAGGPPEGKESP
jgi:hypothetical protein